MAASLPENFACINGDEEGFDQFEVPEVDAALLMSLLEESNAEDFDDERLRSVIRSLEVEIDPNMVEGHNSSMDLGSGSDLDGFQPFDVAIQMNGNNKNCSILHDLDFDWMEVEMIPPSSPCDEMSNWYMDACGDELDGVSDFSNIYYGVNPLEEIAYGSLWQETHNSVMYG